MKRVVCVALALMLSAAFFAGCAEKKDEGLVSSMAQSEIKTESGNISDADKDANSSKEQTKNESQKAPSQDKGANSSIIQSDAKNESQKTPNADKGDNSSKLHSEIKTESENLPDVDEDEGEYEEMSSVSESESVKIYKNKGTVQIGAYGFRLEYCKAKGFDDESKLEEYTDVVNEGYFNTFFVPTNTDIFTHAQVIAESGGTFWLHVGEYRAGKNNMESLLDNAEFYINLLKNKGYGELINGFYWDEPVWRGMTNEEFLTMTEGLYKKFGLRNFPVFATGEFSGLEGNEIGVEADDMNKVLTPSLKYVTDVAFDSYGVDVRDGATIHKSDLDRWQQNVSPNIVDGKSYYVEYKKKLQKHVGHPVNIWYYPCAYEAPLANGLGGLKRANEDYCVAHLEFMAEDILKEEYPGGVILYMYYTSGDRPGIQKHLAIKDENGRYKYYPEEEKWDKYAQALKKVKIKFDAHKAKRADIGA